MDTEINFGKSVFKGRSGIGVDFHRWIVQLAALIIKNTLVLVRRPVQLAFFLCLPGAIISGFLLQKDGHHSKPFENLPPVALRDIGECNAHFHNSCTQVVYSPSSSKYNTIMRKVAHSNGLKFGKDVIGFDTTDSAKTFVASNLGEIQYTIFFRNDALWSTSMLTNISPNQTSYTIFYNASISQSRN